MPRFSFSLKGLLLAVLAIGPLIRYWPPCGYDQQIDGEHFAINYKFWEVVALEAFVIFALIATRRADAARREAEQSAEGAE